jgi:hypothetical protein
MMGYQYKTELSPSPKLVQCLTQNMNLKYSEASNQNDILVLNILNEMALRPSALLGPALGLFG